MTVGKFARLGCHGSAGGGRRCNLHLYAVASTFLPAMNFAGKPRHDVLVRRIVNVVPLARILMKVVKLVLVSVPQRNLPAVRENCCSRRFVDGSHRVLWGSQMV